jgi:proteasome lid subunit RPN8/RPN11
VLEVPKSLLAQTFAHFRACGGGRAECLAYWLGPLEARTVVDEVVHPRHTAHAAAYDVEGERVNELWVRLAAERREVRVQVHTHPGSAFHSGRDDRLALIERPGFLSLVIPGFGLGPVGLDGAHLAIRGDRGRWVEAKLEQQLKLVEP